MRREHEKHQYIHGDVPSRDITNVMYIGECHSKLCMTYVRGEDKGEPGKKAAGLFERLLSGIGLWNRRPEK